jgi:hypothetical protein
MKLFDHVPIYCSMILPYNDKAYLWKVDIYLILLTCLSIIVIKKNAIQGSGGGRRFWIPPFENFYCSYIISNIYQPSTSKLCHYMVKS